MARMYVIPVYRAITHDNSEKESGKCNELVFLKMNGKHYNG
jgi:hypothetical protein